MQIILLERIRNLGHLGDTVTVKPGYGRNYLIPYGKAVPATKENLAHFEARRAELEKIAAEKLSEAKKRAETLNDVTITLVRKTADEGRLYGSVTIQDIIVAASEKGVQLEKHEVTLPNGPIRNTGEFSIDVELHSDVVVALKLMVEAETASA